MILGLIALLAAAAPCTPVPGAERLWQPATRWVIVGEMHGTNETPAAFVNLVCLAGRTGRPVSVAIEYSEDFQPAVDAWLLSDGGAKARAALLEMRIWHREASNQDGRSSGAFLKMFEQLRLMKRLILALVGNFHAIRKEEAFPGNPTRTAGSLMPPARTLTVNVVSNGGRAWFCDQQGCGDQASGYAREAPVGIVYSADADRRWDATYELGVPTTASPPAIPQD